MASIIFFFVSLAFIITMVVIKSMEIQKGKKYFFSRLAEKTDHLFQKVYTAIKDAISYVNKHNLIALLQIIAYHILSWIRKGYLKVHAKAHAHPHSKKVIDMVKGKGEVHKGGASFYLKRISEEN